MEKIINSFIKLEIISRLLAKENKMKTVEERAAENGIELVDLQAKGTKEVNDIALALEDVLMTTGENLSDDGKITGDEAAELVLAPVKRLGAAIDNAKKSGVEFSKMPFHAALGIMVPLMKGMDAVVYGAKEGKENAAELSPGDGA